MIKKNESFKNYNTKGEEDERGQDERNKQW
jgi:hypothetical protein